MIRTLNVLLEKSSKHFVYMIVTASAQKQTHTPNAYKQHSHVHMQVRASVTTSHTQGIWNTLAKVHSNLMIEPLGSTGVPIKTERLI